MHNRSIRELRKERHRKTSDVKACKKTARKEVKTLQGMGASPKKKQKQKRQKIKTTLKRYLRIECHM